MGRLIRIGIYAIVILALYYWVTTMTKGCMPISIPTVTAETKDTTSQDTLNVPVDSIVDTNEVPISNEDIIDGNIDYKEVDKTIETLKDKKPVSPSAVVSAPIKKDAKSDRPVSTPTTKAKPSVIAAPNPAPAVVKSKPAVVNQPSTGGNFMVMAGSYLLKENAEKMVKKLKAKGYNSARVVIFNESEYHSVIAATYPSASSAQSAVNQLKKAGIDSFVRSK